MQLPQPRVLKWIVAMSALTAVVVPSFASQFSNQKLKVARSQHEFC